MSLPGLDGYFRDKTRGKLKRVEVFVVANALAEQPSSPPVQTCKYSAILLRKDIPTTTSENNGLSVAMQQDWQCI